MILPDTDDVDAAPFWRATREGRLMLQRCTACKAFRFPPQPLCGKCRSDRTDWVEAAGRGKLWSFVVHHKPTLEAYAPLTPFPVAVVELEESPLLRMTGNLVADKDAAINSVDPARLKIGMPLRVTFRRIDDDVTLPYWIPA